MIVIMEAELNLSLLKLQLDHYVKIKPLLNDLFNLLESSTLKLYPLKLALDIGGNFYGDLYMANLKIDDKIKDMVKQIEKEEKALAS